MKNILNIFKTKRNNQNDCDIDRILKSNQLDYSEIDFDKKDTDILKSYHELNKKINKAPGYLKNIKSIIPSINYKNILKPVYTIVLTSLVIFTVIELKKTNKPVEFAEVTVNQGEKITLHITDNITIWLNSGSTIRIPMELKRNAKFYLEGEAYFEVNRNKKVTVVSDGITFESKHCNFHINSKDNNQLIAHVKEGSLNFYNPALPKSTKLSLEKGEKALYNLQAEFIAVDKINNTNYLAWHTGVLEFNGEPMNSVVSTISDYFGIPIEIENKEISSQKFTARFKNLAIDKILDTIQLTLNCQIAADGNKLVIN